MAGKRKPVTFDDYIAGKREPATFDAFMAKKADTVVPGPRVPEIPTTTQEQPQRLSERIPFLEPTPNPEEQILTQLLNLGKGAGQLVADLPQFFVKDLPEALAATITGSGEPGIGTMVKEMTKDTAKVIAATALRQLNPEEYERWKQTPEGQQVNKMIFEEPIRPLLAPIIFGGAARGLAKRVGKAPTPRPKAEPAAIERGLIPKERIPTERVPIVEEILGVEKAKPKLEVAKKEVKPAPPPKGAKVEIAETPKEAVAEIIEGKRESTIGTTEFKKRMVAELDEAIATAKEMPADILELQRDLKTAYQRERGYSAITEKIEGKIESGEAPSITIEIPGDGEFKLLHDKATLATLRQKVSRMIEVEKPKKGRTGREGSKAALREAMERGEVTFEPAKKPKPSERGAVLNPFQEIATATSEMIQKAKAPPEITAGVKKAKEAMIEHDRQIRRSESTSKLFENTVNKNIPTDKQMTMVHAYEHKMKGKYWDQLSPLEKKITEWAAGEKAKLNQFIKDNDVLEMMPEQEGINHIFHHWIDPKTGQPFEAMYGKFSKGLPQAKQRTIPTYEAGQAKGLTPATTNLGKLIGLEWESVMRAHQSRQMFKTLHNVGADSKITIQLQTGKKPKPIRMVERWDQLQKQGLTDSYIRYDHWALDKAITFKDANGTLVRLKGAVGIRKELHPFVRAYLENPNYNTLDQLNFATKSAKLGMSMFHVVSLGAQEVANWRIPFKNIPRGRRLIKELDPDMRLLHQEGLDLWKGYEDIGYRQKFFQGKTWVGKTGNVAAYPITLMRSFIFDIVQPGMKASFAYDKFQKVLPKYLERGFTKEQAARAAVKAADGHFSHEHWKRSLLETNRWMVKAYFSPESRRWWQRMLLSPTWQREHLLVAKDVAKSFMPDKLIRKLKLEEMGPIKADYRKYALGAVTMIAAANLYNLMATKEMDGKAKHLWQNPPGRGFAVRALWDEPSYTVKTKDGKKRTVKGGKGYFRPLKSVFEVAESARDPIKKIGYKVSPMISAIGQQFWPSKYRREYKGIEAMPRRALDFVLDIGTPIQVGQTAQFLRGKKSLPGAILPFFGMPTSKVKDKKKKKKRSILSKLSIF
jgi:hypothetical protein